MDQSDPPQSRSKRPPTSGSWKPGTSGNPKGRPRKGNALTESIRAGCDVDELRDLALDLARNGKTEATRLQALCWLRDSGYTRPAEKHELTMAQPDEADDDALAEQLSDDELDALDELDRQRDALLDAARARRALPAGGDDEQDEE